MSDAWEKVLSTLRGIRRYSETEPDAEAMLRIAGRIRDDPTLSDLHPNTAHGAIVLSSDGETKRVCLGWNTKDGFKISTVDEGYEFIDTVIAGNEDDAMVTLRERIVKLWAQV